MKFSPGIVLVPLVVLMVAIAACGPGAGTATTGTVRPTTGGAPALTPILTATTSLTPTVSSGLSDLMRQVAATPVANLSSDVFATGFVAAKQDADLVFQVNGQVAQVLVQEGDRVLADQVLAILDTRKFDQDVRNAEAALIGAQADLAALDEDPTPEEVAAAQAAIAQATGQLNQVQGSVTDQDIAAAQANLDEARASLADLEDGADQLDINAARQRLDQALANLQTTRDQLSHNKTQAEIAIQQQADAVQKAQVAYSDAYWDWQYVRDHDRPPPVTEMDRSPPLSDQSEQGYRDQLNQAELTLHTAEQQLEATRKAYEESRQAEITGIQSAEAQVQQAQTALDQVLEPAEADEFAQAQARVAAAEANLTKLQGQQRAGQIVAAQAGVEAAQANLNRLYSDPTQSQLTRAYANIERAEANLSQAQLNREYAELRAPFAGEVAVVSIDPGDPATTTGGQPAIRLIDLSQLRVEIDVNDADIARVRLGQPARVEADALPEEVFMGEVSFISPSSTRNSQGVTTYPIWIELKDDKELPLRVGMSVSVTIDTAGSRRNANTATPTSERQPSTDATATPSQRQPAEDSN